MSNSTPLPSSKTILLHNDKPIDIDTLRLNSLSNNSTVLDLVKELGLTNPSQAVALYVNALPADFSALLCECEKIELFDFDDAQGRGKEVFWHSTAHILAQAVLRLYPNAQPTIGPAISGGFYYDFAGLDISLEDLKKIEKEMQKIAKNGATPTRETFSAEKAKELFHDNPFKLEIINDLLKPKEDQLSNNNSPVFSGYRQEEFFDLCRGPHLSSLSKVKAIKLLKTSGAYWRGDSTNVMLTRIYGVSFPSKDLLKEHLTFLAEAAARDHKMLGPKLDLFSFHPESPGVPFLHPSGLILFEKLLSFWRELHKKRGYQEIKTPQLLTKSLWETSGHWDHYKENMFVTQSEDREFALKPMSCPGGMLYYKSKHFSYKDLPLKLSEVGLVHRNEFSGALSGLFRVRAFHQDDAHIFLLPEQIAEQVCEILELIAEIYSTFDLSWSLELSTRPSTHTIGTDEQWENATQGLENALKRYGMNYKVNPGDGAFYGPKIDVHVGDAIGRSWQCATIQLDMALPERFNLEYTDATAKRQRPIMLHRAILGSVERFMGILIEHYKGRLPLWLNPQQVRVVPVAHSHHEMAEKIHNQLIELGFHSKVDDRNESMGKRIRCAQLEQVNYMLVIGDKEVETGDLSLRSRENPDSANVSLNEFLEKLCTERNTRSNKSLF